MGCTPSVRRFQVHLQWLVTLCSMTTLTADCQGPMLGFMSEMEKPFSATTQALNMFVSAAVIGEDILTALAGCSKIKR